MGSSPPMSDEVFICRQCHHPIDAVPVEFNAAKATQSSPVSDIAKTQVHGKGHDQHRRKLKDRGCAKVARTRNLADNLESSEEFDNLSQLGESESEPRHFSLCQRCYFKDATVAKESATADLHTDIPRAIDEFEAHRLSLKREKGNDIFSASLSSKDSAIDSDGNLSLSDNESVTNNKITMNACSDMPALDIHESSAQANNCSQTQRNTGKFRNHDRPTSKHVYSEVSNADREQITLSRLIQMQSYMSEYDALLNGQRRNVEEKLRLRKRYYDQLIEKWFWKNMMVVQAEYEKEVAEIARMTKALRQMQSEMAHVKQMNKKQNHETGAEKRKVKSLLNHHMIDIHTAQDRWRQLSFTIGRTYKLDYQCLGPIIPQRREYVLPKFHRPSPELKENVRRSSVHDSVKVKVSEIPRDFFPSKCLYQFDTRNGQEFEYLATGLSPMSNGDLIVTDSGRNSIQMFTPFGERRKTIEITPDVHQTKAVQFHDHVIAVCVSDGVRLYDSRNGTLCNKQFRGVISRPQGLAVNRASDLLVSGYRTNIPVICVYDKRSHRLKNTIFGETFCVGLEEDRAGILPEKLTNHTIFSNAWYISVNHENNLVVSCRDDHSIKTVSSSGDLLEDFGSIGANVGQFFYPSGSCVDDNGNIIVADSHNHRVQVVVPDQQMALVVLSQDHDGIECPMDIALNKDGLLFVLQGNGVVKVFKYS